MKKLRGREMKKIVILFLSIFLAIPAYSIYQPSERYEFMRSLIDSIASVELGLYQLQRFQREEDDNEDVGFNKLMQDQERCNYYFEKAIASMKNYKMSKEEDVKAFADAFSENLDA